MRYLIGKGRGASQGESGEVHVEPHLVAGEPADLVLRHGGRLLTGADARPVAEFLDSPMNEYGTAVSTAVKDGDGVATGKRQAAHVWHCSLALHPDEPTLGDGRWQELVLRYVVLMGFDQTEVLAGCRWVAVRHGLSAGGNDHVHVVVNLVREDGMKADVHNDRRRAQQACRQLEQEFGLRGLESRGRGAGERGVKPAELSGRGGAEVEASQTPRRQLERLVRACGTAAADEAEFVTLMRAEGVLVRPRYGDGGRDDVVGYSVAVAPEGKDKPVWFGGGRLSKELTLPRLRGTWPELEPADRLAIWQRPAQRSGGRTRVPASLEVQAEAATQLAELRRRLGQVPHGDRSTWATVARDTAGMLASLSVRTEPIPGPLAEASRAIARSAQLRAADISGRPYRRLAPTQNTAAVILRAIGRPRSSRALAVELTSLTLAICEMHEAAGELSRARELEATALAQLAVVYGAARRNPGSALADRTNAPQIEGYISPPRGPSDDGWGR